MLSCHNLWVSESDFIINFFLSDKKFLKEIPKFKQVFKIF